MRTVRLHQVDSFTDRRFSGNPAGVVPDADGLTEGEMQAIAREVNASETAFILSERSDGADLRVRYFSPTQEVPICGHATIAAHFVRRLEGAVPGAVRQMSGAGIITVETEPPEAGGRIWMTQRPPVFEPPLDSGMRARIAAALGLDAGALDPDLPVQVVSTGHSKILAPLRRGTPLTGLAPDEAALTGLSRVIGSNGFYPFVHHEGVSQARMFAPAIGIPEDPVTGNAAGPLGAYLVRHGRLLPDADGRAWLDARQGAEIGRPGQVGVEIRTGAAGTLTVRICGAAVLAFSTVLELE